jgi:anti-sigma factor RsiW
MAKKLAHPSRQLFTYLNGALDARAAQAIEAHLATCSECAAVADFIRALRAQASQWQAAASPSASANRESESIEAHPDASALATFFYSKSSRARDGAVAAHIALCEQCADDLAEYARAEHAAAIYTPARGGTDQVPAAAWEMIREWEDSSFAKPKPASEAVSQQLLARLLVLLGEQREQLQADDRLSDDVVPVMVVDREGELRRVEHFRKIRNERGTGALKHIEASEVFDNKPVHTLLDFGDEKRLVISERISHDTLRVPQTTRTTKPLHADYFIIED